MTIRFTTAMAVLAICTGAAAAEPPSPPDKAEMQRHFTDMCQDRQAREAGALAYLEAKLALTAQQKPLFERWKKVKLDAAKSGDCTPPTENEPSLVDGLKREEQALRHRLEELKTERPALEALAASLSAEQKHAFAPPHHEHGPHGDQPPGPEYDGHHAPPPPEH